MTENRKDLFEFAEGDELNNADKIKTRSLSYFQDALIRFKKNKLNVIATFILGTLILMSFLIPLVSSKPYSSGIEGHNDANLKFLTPRIQFLEKFGVFDGTKKYNAVPLDLENELPLGIEEEFIKNGEIRKYSVGCNSSTVECLGGTVVYGYESEVQNEIGFAIKTVEKIDYSLYSEIVIDIENVSSNISVEYFRNDLSEASKLNYLTDNNVINISSLTEESSFGFALTSSSTENGQTLKVNNITFKSTKGEDDLIFEGSELLRKVNPATDVTTEGGKMELLKEGEKIYSSAIISRENSEMLVGDFKLDLYTQAFTSTQMNLSQEEFDELTEGNDNCTYTEEVINGVTVRTYGEGCTIKTAVADSCIITPSGEACVYDAEIDYLSYKGYDELPYYWFGTDSRGHDLFTKIFKGLNSSLLFGLLAAGINILIGVVYGAVSGYYGGKTDLTLQRVTEFIGGVPFIVSLTLANLYFGQGLHTVAIVVCLTGWISISKMTRAQFYRYKGREYVLASRSLGASDKRLIFRHILPNGIGIIVTTGVLMIPSMVTLEATLSYLGLGLSGDFSLGLILANGQSVGVSQFPHLTLFPTLIVCILMITFNLFGMALRDALNPSLRGND